MCPRMNSLTGSPWAVSDQGVYAFGEGGFRVRSATRTTAGVGKMLGHQQGLGAGKVEDLSGWCLRHGLVQGRAATGAGFGEMVDGGIRACRPAECLTGMALLCRHRDRAVRRLRQKPRDKAVLRELAKGGVIHQRLRIWNLPLCQLGLAPPPHENRPRAS